MGKIIQFPTHRAPKPQLIELRLDDMHPEDFARYVIDLANNFDVSEEQVFEIINRARMARYEQKVW